MTGVSVAHMIHVDLPFDVFTSIMKNMVLAECNCGLIVHMIYHNDSRTFNGPHVFIIASFLADGVFDLSSVILICGNNVSQSCDILFLDINITHVMPYDIQDMEGRSLEGFEGFIFRPTCEACMKMIQALHIRAWVSDIGGAITIWDLHGWKFSQSGPSFSTFWFAAFPLHQLWISFLFPDITDERNWLFALEGTEEESTYLWQEHSVGDHGVDIEGAKWTMDNVKFSVKEPIEAVATKEELEHLVMLCRSEADAMGRITAGILRLLKLDKSLGQGTIEQLRNLGSGGMDNIFSPRRLSRQNSFGSIGTPRTPTMQAIADVMGSKTTLEATISSLQGEISESKAK
ncbi:hypothetical protein ACJX0J_041270, partial [Zea mays]